MKILHYLSGLPPVRGGGMINYALDLAAAQNKVDEVYLLLPGKISINKRRRIKVSIHKGKRWNQLPTYKIQNPLPIPMANGILDINWYTLPCRGNAYKKFLEKLHPDVIHIHTFMGLHAEFLEAAVQQKIAVIYTTHNYFGICPKADLMCCESICEHPGKLCEKCSKSAFSNARLLLEQSSFYRMYRKSPFLVHLLSGSLSKNCFKNLRSSFPEIQQKKEQEVALRETETEREKIRTAPMITNYRRLLNYYHNMFCMITYFHFNSTTTRTIYEKHLGKLNGEVLGVSNSNIYDRRKSKNTDEILKIGFLGGDGPYKGRKRLLQVVQELYYEGFSKIELQIYGSREKETLPFCKYYDSYSADELEHIFQKMDLLIVPSHEPETFGMVVLEALSFGVPVLVTDKVGAQDILTESQRAIGKVIPDSLPEMKKALIDFYLHKNKIEEMGRNILQENLPLDYTEYTERIHKMYERSTALQAKIQDNKDNLIAEFGVQS